jgi:tetratricopeptide (TPR) repeat protein
MRRLWVLIAILTIWIFTVASSPVVTGAKVRLKAKKYQETVDVLEENKGKYLDDPELFYYLARAYAGIANWEKAGENFGAALTKNPDKSLKKDIDKWRDYYWIQFVKDAGALLDQKRYLDAIGKFRTANMINPDRVESQANLGVALLEQAQLEQSAEPPQPDSAKMLFDEAIERMKKAIELDPENEQFFKNLGQAYIIAGMEDEAIEHYENYLAENPDDIAAQKRLVTIYMSRRDYEKAVEGFDALFDDAGVEMGLADYFNAGSSYYQMYYKLSKLEDEDSKAKAREMLEKSAECFAMVAEEDPTDCEAGEQLYYIYISLEEWSEVIKTIETMLDNGCERSYITLSNLSVAYSNIGDTNKAGEIYREAQEKKPKEEGQN